ncbi:MAG: aspartate 1-decarboxylase [bacterium]
MIRRFLKSKIHHARVTQTDLDYVGSVTVDRDLFDASDIAINEQVEVYNITTGARFTTYAIEGQHESGIIGVNGAAAHHANVGDLVIIVTYCDLSEDEISGHQPKVLLVDKNNWPA